MELEQWKQKYYDQLDRLEKKEADWEKLESILKKTIGRLGLAAEGQHKTLDRHINELRNAIKNSIDRQRLDTIVDDISRTLAKIEDKQSNENRASIHSLELLIQKLSLPKRAEKPQAKLLKKFANADDTKRDELLNDSLNFLLTVITNDSSDTQKPGLMDRLFQPNKTREDTGTPATNTPDNESRVNTDDQQLSIYKNCLLELLSKLDNPDSPSGKISALKLSARDAQQKNELDKLIDQLSNILQSSTPPVPSTADTNHTQNKTSTDNSQPSIQELLIRLLEQLIIPDDLQDAANKMKHRLEQATHQTMESENWKALLKEVAQLINSIRSRLQQEKHEFENFLQQVTDRLKTLDQFLQSESSNLLIAETQGKEFDKQMGLNVDEIRHDINQATELTSLKENVNSKLDTIAGHIQTYRESENTRLQNSQKEVDAMHNKMQTLETESVKLKKLVIEKNRLAMFDTLTGIPNRLSYEKKAAEEIARWKRFSNPLSLAIWDIDFFKKVNDSYGHKAGDKVLKTVAQLLVKSIRETDFLARYGGEEFVMLLPGTRQEETLRLVNKLRQQIENCGFHYHGEAVKITVSCGVSSFNDGDSLNQVFERADNALYKAKENGRNQCVIAACLSD